MSERERRPVPVVWLPLPAERGGSGGTRASKRLMYMAGPRPFADGSRCRLRSEADAHGRRLGGNTELSGCLAENVWCGR